MCMIISGFDNTASTLNFKSLDTFVYYIYFYSFLVLSHQKELLSFCREFLSYVNMVLFPDSVSWTV